MIRGSSPETITTVLISYSPIQKFFFFFKDIGLERERGWTDSPQNPLNVQLRHGDGISGQSEPSKVLKKVRTLTEVVV